MAEMTFAELQRAMQLGKSKKQGVKYAFRNAEEIYTKFKELGSAWAINAQDEIVEIGGRLFVKALVTCWLDEVVYQSTGYAELANVPILQTKDYNTGEPKEIQQMQVPQWTGAVSSYARKYALQGLFAIGEKDVDEFPVEQDQKIQTAPPRNPEVAKELIFLKKTQGMNPVARDMIADAEKKMNLVLDKFPDNAIRKLTDNVKKAVNGHEQQ